MASRNRTIWATRWVTALVAAVVLAGCLPQGSVLSRLFIPLPPSQPVVHAPRRVPPEPPKPAVAVLPEVPEGPPPTDWAAVYASLPRDSKGVVDWVRAAAEQTITPRPGIAEDAIAADTADSEIELVNDGEPGKPATFRHATHTQWLSCKNCHPALFKKRSDNLQFTHEQMDEGRYCGACHGKVVELPGGCKGCHARKKAA